jgi:hypothetical protein
MSGVAGSRLHEEREGRELKSKVLSEH